MEEPEWPPVCECRYDEVQDRMDREDCCFHFDMEDELTLPQKSPKALKKPAEIARRDEENAA